MSGSFIKDKVIEYYVDNFSAELTLSLLKVLSFPEQGGLGYRLELFNPMFDMDGWEIDHSTQVIKLDTKSFFVTYSSREMAIALKEAIETDFIKSRASMLSRIGWGTGKILLGLIESSVGLIGIVVPEPGTTAAGVGMVILGSNTIGDGISQLAGANQNNGYNVLGTAFGAVGSAAADLTGFDPEIGKKVGRGVFIVASFAFGSVGSIKILNVKSISAIRFGVGGEPGGLQIGRLAMGYPSSRAKDGMTIFNISNNSGQWILRFVTHGGKLVVNGRIVGVQRVLNHENNWKLVVKGLLKLLAHGTKAGL